MQVSEDHFVKVRTLIKDLLSKLSSDAESEATQKGFCDKRMSAAVAKRDQMQGQVETDTAEIASLRAEDQQLEKETLAIRSLAIRLINTNTVPIPMRTRIKTCCLAKDGYRLRALAPTPREEIAELSAGIAENLKAKNEATELRAADKAENERTVADAEAGKSAVENALQVLKDFYGGAALSFLQFDPAGRVTAANMDLKSVSWRCAIVGVPRGSPPGGGRRTTCFQNLASQAVRNP